MSLAKQGKCDISHIIALALLTTTLVRVTTYQAGLTISKVCRPGPCIGTIDDDKLVGSGVFDDMDGLKDDDSLNARAADDVVFADAGNNKIIIASRDDGIEASFGNDKVDSGNGYNTMWQFRASNHLDGSKHVISCVPGDDTAYYSLKDGDSAACDCLHVITNQFS
jgi:hypothetical protein